MQFRERVFHSILFEIGAMAISAIAIRLTGSFDTTSAIETGVSISIIAMLWNLVFNLVFDQFFTGKREERSFSLRVFHTISFEGGLLLFTIPVVAYLLDLSLWLAFLADVGLTLIIMLYTLVFNWIYDITRAKYFAYQKEYFRG
ncbi:PACE efflux transporter [Glaesserella sp.]|uniref:PACE efflux transporter n=1 Tax=Glaesserella sp. TaxID=2094731 RepID=UPI0035A1B3F4